MPLKSADFHRLVRARLGPQLKGLGFKGTPKTSTASWARPENGRWLVLWFQPSSWNQTHSPGFKFTVEFDLCSAPVIGGNGYRERLPRLLSPSAREELRLIENRAIAKLPPPDSAVAECLPPRTRKEWLRRWEPRLKPYAPDEDVWFRHGDEADLEDLVTFVDGVLSSAIDLFLARARAAR